MSVVGRVGGKIKNDAVAWVTQPREFVAEMRYVAAGIREGEVSPAQVLVTLATTLLAIGMVAVVLFPIYWIFISAISGTGGSIYSTDGIRLWPGQPSLKPFLWVVGDLIVPGLTITVSIPLTDLLVVFNTPRLALLDVSEIQRGTVLGFRVAPVENPSEFKRFMWNSLTVAIPTVLLAMSLIVPGAYALSRREFILRKKILFTYVLLTQVGGGLGIAVLIALFAMFVQVGLTNNKLALAVYYASTAVPFNTWLLKTYMDGIPVSYEEAAVVDGAPPWRVVWEVILPLSAAGLATVFIFVFLTGWTEFVVAQTLLGTENYTLPVGLFSLVGRYDVPWARFSAFALTFASPIMLVYLFAQRYIEGGLSFGGVEG